MHATNRSDSDDPWTWLSDEEPLPATAVIVSLARWLRERKGLLEHPGRLGVLFAGEDDPYLVARDVERLTLIVLTFRPIGDGRGYSQARLLRERLGYRGELRAVGDLLTDHLHFLFRCGIDSAELPDGTEHTAIVRGLMPYSVSYQPAGDGGELALRRLRRERLEKASG